MLQTPYNLAKLMVDHLSSLCISFDGGATLFMVRDILDFLDTV